MKKKQNQRTFDDATKYRVFTIEPRCWYGRDKELTPVGARARIRHANGKRSIVPELLHDFVSKFTAPYGFTAGSIAKWITRLQHETGNDAMKNNIVVVAVTR